MINFFKRLIPQSIIIYYNQYCNRKKFDVKFGKLATANNCVFEGKNLINNAASISDSYIGFGTFISGKTILKKARIGKFCSIGQNVQNGFGIHPTTWVSTHPAFYSLQKQAGFTFVENQLFEEHKYIDDLKKYYIQIGNDVWIGNNVQILDGITIGDGAIIALGSIVTKDVEPYSIVGGIPACLIRKKFSNEDIKWLLEFKWWDRDLNWLKEKAKLFTSLEKLK
jgi:acetyltransferase-like isoleucine patch superfamily enzyme